MKIKSLTPSLNTDGQIIDVQFLILHYTACSLEKALEIFQDKKSQVSCHLLIDKDGGVFEVLPCFNQKPVKAFHAGVSFWKDSQKKEWKEFNNISLGIELVSENGNIFPYTAQQYQSLSLMIHRLKSLYPALKSPERVLGHEHIAGFRGKADPGCSMNWDLLFKKAYPEFSSFPQRKAILPLELKERFECLASRLEEKDWSHLSTLLEQQLRHYLKTQ